MGDLPQGQGTPCRVPPQPFSMVYSALSICLEGQTTFESNETRTVATVSKIASQRLKNHIDTTSVLREKPRKQKDTQKKRPNDEAWPSPEPPNWGARLLGLGHSRAPQAWRSAIG